MEVISAYNLLVFTYHYLSLLSLITFFEKHFIKLEKLIHKYELFILFMSQQSYIAIDFFFPRQLLVSS